MTTRRDVVAMGAAALALAGTRGRAQTGAGSLISEEVLAEIERRSGGRLGVAVLDTATGRRASWRGGERFAMSSTFKARSSRASSCDASSAARRRSTARSR